MNIELNSFNWVDITVLSIVCLSTLLAMFNGFLSSMLSLFGWILSIFLTYHGFPLIQPYLHNKITSELAVIILGYSGLLLFWIIVFGFVNVAISPLLNELKKGIFDKILGIFFGLMRGILIISFIFLCCTLGINFILGNSDKNDEDDIPEAVKSAQTYPMIKFGKDFLLSIMPSSFSARVKEMADTVTDKNLDERFFDSCREKLSSAMDDETIKNLELKKKELLISQSEEMADTEITEDLLEEYKKKKSNNTLKENVLSKDEISRLEKFINKKKSALLEDNSVIESENIKE